MDEPTAAGGRDGRGGLSRRQVLKAGGAAAALYGLSARPAAAATADSLVLVWLAGGPSQLDTWDPKPAAPAGVRGQFGTVATRLPGVRFAAPLHRTAALADELCVIRSLAAPDTDHQAAAAALLTGPLGQVPDPFGRRAGADPGAPAGEPESVCDRYGRHAFGRRCLWARRQVAAGVRHVSVVCSGWDTHTSGHAALGRLLPQLDQGLAALLADLRQCGWLSRTLVVVAGEFGRTPWLNGAGGRDHHARCFSAVLAGGGIRGGQVIGASDAIGAEPVARPVSLAELLATISACLGRPTGRVAPVGEALA